MEPVQAFHVNSILIYKISWPVTFDEPIEAPTPLYFTLKDTPTSVIYFVR